MVIIYPNMGIKRRERLDDVLERAGVKIKTREHTLVTSLEELKKISCKGEKILFAVALNDRGFNVELYSMLNYISGEKSMFQGSVAAVVVDGPHEEETKALARRLVYRVNESGCTFPGKALVEATGSLRNFNTVCMLEGLDEKEAYILSVKRLIMKLESTHIAVVSEKNILPGVCGETQRMEEASCMEEKSFGRLGVSPCVDEVFSCEDEVSTCMDEFSPCSEELSPCAAKSGDVIKKANLLVITSGKLSTSNTLALWHKVESFLPSEIEIEKISLRDGEILECRGCPYEECLHFGEAGKCFYGGLVTEKIYSAIVKCNALLIAAPNYNDALSADFTAFINRLTALYRVYDFSEKVFFSIIVSGYSGGDILAQQLIGALNFNKNMMLPPKFSLRATANAPGSLDEDESIDERARTFAEDIKKVLITGGFV